MKNIDMKKFNGIKKKTYKYLWVVSAVFCSVTASTIFAFADDGVPSSMFTAVLGTICKFVTALGGVVALIGGINWALGFKSEDSDAQVRGIRTLIAGAAVIAVVQAAKTFVSDPTPATGFITFLGL
ncbi:hypothetical protein [Ruminococcus sp.]|uniref:hypothetical protein n=1 Tax=Ruminococcus sp. TaxID=41978 RepID=UPI0025DCF277|nr:hypothetical protein [Ruminococcus sp.]MBQ8967278.1 hypothetical protein [Ruminococcus sp.]